MGQGVEATPEVSLGEIVTYVSTEYGVSDGELRGASRNRKVSEARAMIGWLSRRLGAGSIKEVAIYFQRDASTFSRHIGKIDTEAKKSDKARDRLNSHVNAITQA